MRRARAQAGVVTRAQLAEAGLRTRARQPTSVPRRSVDRDRRAALGVTTAAKAWGIRAWAPSDVDVGVPTSGGVRSRHGIRLHRLGTLRREHVTTLPKSHIPVTTVARTLLDLSLVLSSADLRKAFSEATVRRLVTAPELQSLLQLERAPALRPLVNDLAAHGSTVLRSTLEALMLQLCVDGGLPRPEVNARRTGGRWTFNGRRPGSSLRWTHGPGIRASSGSSLIAPAIGVTPLPVGA